MPQMAPLWWDILYMLFLFMFSLMSLIIYFSVTKMNNKNNKKLLKNNQMTWKW